jgi:acetylornithine deacetylase/succinyl-diaminopimelate desuccinylase-like protein
MDALQLRAHVDRVWDEQIVPALTEYIRIPNKSPAFDPEWASRGHMDRAVQLIAEWCKVQPIRGLSVEVVRHGARTPVILMEVPASPGAREDTVLLYGHLDKQPEMTGWAEGLGPWVPALKDDKLYGRGGADDGYSAFASLTAIAALQAQGVPHARCVVIIEASEESGSPDLPHYIEALADRIGTPSLVICLDSGCGDYEHLWCTTSLRGMVVGELSVSVLREGVHSGDASGIVPSSFRVLRQLLSRLEDETTGLVKPADLSVEIPAERRVQAAAVAQVLGAAIHDKFPFQPGARPVSADLAELVLNRTWRPALSITGADGMPRLADAGNVSRPRTAVKVSLRLPPTCDHQRAYATVKRLFETEPPYGAQVSFEGSSDGGWSAPPLAPWLERSLEAASRAHFGTNAVHMGEGGSIPFMGMLGKRFPKAQFMITGVLGPHSNAHGPNEFLHIPTGKKVTACVAQVLADHLGRESAGE